MKSMRLSEIIEVAGGNPQAVAGDDPVVSGICTDSRALRPGELFIPRLDLLDHRLNAFLSLITDSLYLLKNLGFCFP